MLKDNPDKHLLIADIVCKLSLARDLDSIMLIVCNAVRSFAGADGTTFILRENDQCYYADEEAISPLWKGRRFHVSECISGWVMIHKKSVAIQDVFSDDRIPIDMYRSTFVKSLLMVPIRSAEPIGAIGVYWSKEYLPSDDEQYCIQAVADSAAIAVENARVNIQLRNQIAELENERHRLAGIIESTRADERKSAEKALRESEREMKRAQSIANIGSWHFDLNSGMVIASDQTIKIYGILENDLTIKLVQTIPLPEYRKQLDTELKKLIEFGIPYDVEFKIRRPSDHAIRHIHSVAEYDSEQKVVFGILQDITEQKIVEQQKWESENRFRSFVENANDIVYALTPEGVFSYISPNWLDYMGEPPEKAIGKRFEPYVHPEDVQLCHDFLETVLEKGKKQSGVEYRVKHCDGTWRWHVSNGAPLLNDTGTITGYIGIARDITDQKKMEDALRDNEAMLQAALDNSLAGVAIASAPDGKLRYVNDAALRIRGKSKNEVVEKIGIQNYVEIWQLYHMDGRPFKDDEVPLARAILQGETCSKEFIIRRDNGEDRIVWANAAPIYGRNGNIVAGIVVFLDITETRRLNERLRQAEKMESIGTLAGGIAHDFNNILGGIIGYADMSLDDVPPGSQLAKNIQRILDGGDRAKNLVRQILNFSRRGNEERTPQYLRMVLKEVIELLRASLPSSIEIKSNLARDTIPVLADPTQIHEIVMNLCTNAAHAMNDDKGVLEITYKEAVFEQPIEGRAGTVPPGMYSVIRVQDNGCGMDAITLKRIFEPFFTTKPQGKGTGMGMAVLYGIVQRHQGTVTVESEPGKGTTVEVYLPKCHDDRSVALSDEEAPVERGTERILFVDDEQVITGLASDTLTNLGYTVTVYNDPIQALKVFRDKPDSFDLVITDQTMPSMSGLDLAREIRTIKAEIPIILCTGYSRLVDESTALAAGISGFLAKPFRQRFIAHKIRHVLQKKSNP
jgi:PAS domain S-box-containing protein